MSEAVELNARVASMGSGLELPHRLADRACTIIQELKGKSGLESFRSIRWHASPHFKIRQSWLAEEQRLIKRDHDQILCEEKWKYTHGM